MTHYRNKTTNEVFTVSERVEHLVDLVNDNNQHIYVSNSELKAQYEIVRDYNDPYRANFYR